jgi:hypothetical protein
MPEFSAFQVMEGPSTPSVPFRHFYRGVELEKDWTYSICSVSLYNDRPVLLCVSHSSMARQFISFHSLVFEILLKGALLTEKEALVLIRLFPVGERGARSETDIAIANLL